MDDNLIVPVHNAYAQSEITQGMYFDLLGETYQKVQQHPILKAAQILKDLEKN